MSPPETNGVECRICNSNTTSGLIRSPCHCTGSLDCVHIGCLEKWLNASAQSFCELCSYKFEVRRVRRYSFSQSVFAWIRRNRNVFNRLLLYVLCSAVMTVLLGLASFLWISTLADVIQDRNSAKETSPSQGGYKGVRSGKWLVFYSFLLILCVLTIKGFCVRSYYIVNNQYRGWHRFWHETLIIQLALDPDNYKLKNNEEQESHQTLNKIDCNSENVEETLGDIKELQPQEEINCNT